MDAGEWRRWERLIDERGIVIDRPRGHAHPLYADMIYHCDYGHVPGTTAADGEEIDVSWACHEPTPTASWHSSTAAIHGPICN